MTPIAKSPPASDNITPYDQAMMAIYLRVFDADRDGADWVEAARVIFGEAAENDLDDLRAQHRAHLDRARWLVNKGYLRLAGLG